MIETLSTLHVHLIGFRRKMLDAWLDVRSSIENMIFVKLYWSITLVILVTTVLFESNSFSWLDSHWNRLSDTWTWLVHSPSMIRHLQSEADEMNMQGLRHAKSQSCRAHIKANRKTCTNNCKGLPWRFHDDFDAGRARTCVVLNTPRGAWA